MAADIVFISNEESSKAEFLKIYPFAKILNTDTSEIKKILNVVNTTFFWIVFEKSNWQDFDFQQDPTIVMDKNTLRVVNGAKTMTKSIWCVKRLFLIKFCNQHNCASFDALFEDIDGVNKTDNTNLFNFKKALEDYDIIHLSYDEDNADYSFYKLYDRFPNRVKRIQGIKGIKEAHRAAAELSSTPFFYVVDCDADVDDHFMFNYGEEDMYNNVIVFSSLNPVNGLKYGWGGIKIFSKQTVLNNEVKETSLDFTTAISNKGVINVPYIASIARFNTSPFNTWRSVFRECVKLSSSNIENSNATLNKERLNTWITQYNKDEPFSYYGIHGGFLGKKFGETNKDNPSELKKINDFDWLLTEFI